MLPFSPPPKSPITNRPVISNKTDNEEGRAFTVTFTGVQELPPHRNSAPIEIRATAGSGEITLGENSPQKIVAGESVKLEAGLLHSVRSTNEGLAIRVRLLQGDR